MYPIFAAIFDYTPRYNPAAQHYQQAATYIRRTGFVPKRLSL